MDLVKKINELFGIGEDPKKARYKAHPERQSKHMGLKFRLTKAYKDDRQKAPKNRRKYGRRKRK